MRTETWWVATALAGLLICMPLQTPPQSSDGRSLLAEAGMDVSLLNTVENGTAEAFVEDENELFAGLASAMIRIEEAPPGVSAESFDLMKALQTPTVYKGNFVELRGTVRRVTPVQITSANMREKTARTVYHQVDLFVSANKTNFHLKDDQGEVVISGTYGITLILFELPDVIRDAKKHATVSLPGFYIKNWIHKTAETRGVSSELRRPNPIVFGIGSLATTIEREAGPGGSIIGWFLGGIMALLTGLGAWQWWSNRNRKSPSLAGTGPVDLSHLEQD